MKQVVRIIIKTHFYFYSDPIFENLDMLTFHGLHLLQVGQLYMYSYQIEHFLCRKVTLNREIHTYNVYETLEHFVCLCVGLTIFCFLSPK